MSVNTGQAIDVHAALQDPLKLFSGPEEVLNHPALAKDDKIKILQHGDNDVRDVEVAEEEGMPSSNEEDLLRSILKALEELGADSAHDGARSPTKHGNV